jgi:hypothetical protein
MQFGPVQLIAFAFEGVDKFKGEILRELDLLRGRGLIRIIDLLFIAREQDGSLRTLKASDLLDYEAAEFGAMLWRLLGLGAPDAQSAYLGGLLDGVMGVEGQHGLSLDDIRAAAEGIPAGRAAGLLLIEHAWAVPFGEAILRAGGQMVAQGFLTRHALVVVGHEIEATARAEAAIERAEALRGVAMLDALTTAASAEALKGAAADEAAALVTTEVAAQAVRALIVAGLLEEAAAPEAVEALVAAGLIAGPACDEAACVAQSVYAEPG